VKLRTLLALAAILALAVPALAQAAQRGRVGGPPTLRFDRAKHSGKLTTKPLVIDRTRSVLGPAELVAYGTKHCLTIELDIVFERATSPTCHTEPGAREISFDGAGWYKRRKRGRGQFSLFLGGAGSEVAAIAVDGRGRRGGKVKRDGLFARPNEDLLRRLNAEPFAAWGALLLGCVSGKRLTVRAFDLSGSLLATRHDPWQGGGFYPCK